MVPSSHASEVAMTSGCPGWAIGKQAPISRLLPLFLVWYAELVLLSQGFSQVSGIPAQGSSKISASLSCIYACVPYAEQLNAIVYLIRSEP